MSNPTISIEVCFSPQLYPIFHKADSIVVITDILRATSAICTAFMNGAEKIIPVETIDEAKSYKAQGYLVAAERDGSVIDFADFGNSPYNFTREMIRNKTIIYSTTNGTQAIHLASGCYKVIIGSFLNLTACCKWLLTQRKDIVILCSGWKNKFNLEDTLHAGAIVEKILEDRNYSSICDSAHASLDLWRLAKPDVISYIQKAAQRSRLKANKLDDVIEYCFKQDLTQIIPVLEGNYLVKMEQHF